MKKLLCSAKKKWIAGFGFIILFLLPQLCLGDLYDITCESVYVFDEYIGNNPSICRIDDTHHLVQANAPGFIFSDIRVLTVDPETGEISSGDAVSLGLAAMEVTILQIDYTHYFCVYETLNDYEAAVVTVDPDTWSLSVETYFSIDIGPVGLYIHTSKINENHFLVTCQSHSTTYDSELWAIVLNVDTNDWEITGGDPYMITDENNPRYNRVISIDETHHLCVFADWHTPICRATVLNVDLEDLTVSNEMIYDLQIDNDVHTLDLIKYDDTHIILYYSVITGTDFAGYAVVLTVDSNDWSITKENPFLFDALGLDPDLSRIDDTHYLCSYISVNATNTIGKGVVLTLNPADWTFTMETPNDQIMSENAHHPMLSKINEAQYIVVFTQYDDLFFTYSGAAQVLNVEIITGVDSEIIPVKVLLQHNYPNPFNQTTTISFSTTENTELIIYNLNGQKVKSLINQNMEAGEHSVVWDGTTDTGKPVGSGIYFYQLKAGYVYSKIKKMLLIK